MCLSNIMSQRDGLRKRRIHPILGRSKLWWHFSGSSLGGNCLILATAHCIYLLQCQNPLNQLNNHYLCHFFFDNTSKISNFQISCPWYKHGFLNNSHKQQFFFLKLQFTHKYFILLLTLSSPWASYEAPPSNSHIVKNIN